jgi:hypothetical protein
MPAADLLAMASQEREPPPRIARMPQRQDVDMIPGPAATDVRRLVVEQFQKLGVAEIRDDALLETILISDGKYRGRSYRVAGMMATWFAEIGLVQFYGPQGEMLGTFTLGDRPTPAKRLPKVAA